ncbi:hypothetical protein NBRC116494_00500 [Aurantivibrio plasticivorans]
MSTTTDDLSVEKYRLQSRRGLTVDENAKPFLRQLMKLNERRFLLYLGCHVAVWIFAATAIVQIDNLAFQIVLSIILGNQLHAFTVLQHECIHGTAFKAKNINYWLGVILAWFIIMPYTTFKECHLCHHRYLGDTCKDPDEWNYGGGTVLSMLLRIMTFVPRFVFISTTRYGNLVAKRVLVELLTNIITWLLLGVTLIYTGHGAEFFLIFVLPLLILAVVINPASRGYEHFPLVYMKQDDQFLRADIAKSTVSVTHPVFSILWANINYHVEHHVYPGVPFYNLPALSKLMNSKNYLRRRFIFEKI